VEKIAASVDPGKAAFAVSTRRPAFRQWILQVDAMWATTLAHRPTVNGYSGNWPPDWGGQIWMARSGSKEQRARFTSELTAWLSRHGVNPESVQWIELGPRYRRGQR
jgi:hypothetical protein